jgi:hypothetical protein
MSRAPSYQAKQDFNCGDRSNEIAILNYCW